MSTAQPPSPAPSSAPSLSGREAVAILAFGTLLTLVFFHRAAFTEQIFIYRDIFRVYYPLRHFWAEQVSQGRFPGWYPYDGLGQSFVGMIISGAFHPSNFLYLFLPLGTALKVNILLCFPLAMLGMALLLRTWGLTVAAALVGATAYAFSGYFVTVTGNLLYLMAAFTVPWGLWAATRYFRDPDPLGAVAAGLLLCLILFAGDAQAFAVTCAGVVVLGLVAFDHPTRRRGLIRVGALLGLTALLAAIQLLPALHVSEWGVHSRISIKEAQFWSLHPLRLVELVLGPFFAGEPATPESLRIDKQLLGAELMTLWVDSVHLGILPFTLAVLALARAPRDRPYLLVFLGASLSLVLALGKYAAAYEFLYTVLPAWRPFRYPEKLLPFLLLTLAVGSAWGYDWILATAQRRRRASWALAALAGVVLIAYGLELTTRAISKALVLGWQTGVPPASVRERLHEQSHRMLLYSALSPLFAGATLFWVRRPLLRAGLIAGVVFANQFASNEREYILSFPDLLNEPASFGEIIREREGAPALGGYRVFSGVDGYQLPKLPGTTHADRYAIAVSTSLEPVTPALFGLEAASIYLPGASRRLSLLRDRRLFYERFSGMLSVRYIAMAAPAFARLEGRSDAVLAEQKTMELVLLHNPNALPRTYLAWPVRAASDRDALRLMSHEAFDPRRGAVVIGGDLPSEPVAAAGAGKVVSARFETDRIDVAFEANTPAVLVVTDAYAPGWSATLDGKPIPIEIANFALRGVRVPAGRHQVTMTYNAPLLAEGSWISLSTLMVGLGVGLWCRFRKTATG